MNSKYITKALTKVLTMPALPGGRPFAYEKGETITAYCDNYCAWAVPTNGNTVTNPNAYEMHHLIERMHIDYDILHEVKDTGNRRIIDKGRKKVEIAIFACDDFEIHINSGMLKLFDSLNCTYYAKSFDTQLYIEDADRIADGYAIGIIMPVKPVK